MESERPDRDRHGSRGLAASAAVAALVLSVLFRLATWEEVLGEDPPRFEPHDDQYHAIRIAHSAVHFPGVLDFDPARGARGAFCPWPPLYDLAAGGAVRLLGGTTEAKALARAAWLPVAVSSVFLAFLSGAAVRRFGALGGISSSIALVLSLPLVWISRLGNLDHHFLEAPLLLGIAAALGLVAAANSRADLLRSGLLLGLALSAALFVESAFLFAAALGFLGLFLAAGTDRSPLLAGGLGFGLAAAAVAGYRWARPGSTPDGAWYLGTPHAAALFAAALTLGTLAFLSARGARPGVARLLALSLGTAAVSAVPGALAAYGEGASYFGGDPSLSTIRELSPLFFGSRTPFQDLLLSGGSGFLTFVFAADALSSRRKPRLVLSVLLLGYFAGTLLSRHFLVAAVPLFALAGGAVVADRELAGRRTTARLSAAVLVVPALLGAWEELRHPSPMVSPEGRAFERAARYLAGRTDAPGRVLGPWSWGHLLHRLGERPVLLDNFGPMIGRVAFDEAQVAVLGTREELLARWCTAHGVRFVVLENPLRLISRQAESAGLDPGAFLRSPVRPDEPPAVTRLAQVSFWWRAYFDGGAALPQSKRSGSPFRYFRRAWADPEASAEPPPYRGPLVEIWELASAAP